MIARPAHWPEIAFSWNALEEASAKSSFLLSPDWTSAWLNGFAETLRPEVLLFESAGHVVGACLLVGTVARRGPFRIRRLYKKHRRRTLEIGRGLSATRLRGRA